MSRDRASMLLVGVLGCSGDAWEFRSLDAGTVATDRPATLEDEGTSPTSDTPVSGVREDVVRPPEDIGTGARCNFTGAACDPVRNAGCPAGQVCYPYAARPTCGAPAAAPGWDEPCASSGELCAPGFRCSNMSGRLCKRVCCPGNDGTCMDSATGGRPGARCTGTVFTDVGNCE